MHLLDADLIYVQLDRTVCFLALLINGQESNPRSNPRSLHYYLKKKQTNTFSSFASSLFSTSRHHSRSVAASSALRQYRVIAYIVMGVVVLWLVMKVWRNGPGPTAPAATPLEGEY